ncbi:dephospho-CoA kinase [Thalassotalea euphylliae]|uniref:dephospho-CoA kinase n=1 Tax=Thalassotalea euphylliae TaxID=1655234 RepID=UPI0036318EEA
MIVGLTGGIGSGKTTVANLFHALGIIIVDADIVARQVVKPGTAGLKAIIERFGIDILDKNNELNRAKLRELIFNNEEDKLWLNALLHPLIREEMLTQLRNSESPYTLLVAPLLFENKLEQFTNRTLVVDIPEELQIARTVARDNNPPELVKNIIEAQIERQTRLSKADDVIDNSDNDLEKLNHRIEELHQQYLMLTSSLKN